MTTCDHGRLEEFAASQEWRRGRKEEMMVVVFPELLLSATSVATSPTYRYQEKEFLLLITCR